MGCIYRDEDARMSRARRPVIAAIDLLRITAALVATCLGSVSERAELSCSGPKLSLMRLSRPFICCESNHIANLCRSNGPQRRKLSGSPPVTLVVALSSKVESDEEENKEAAEGLAS